MLQCPNERIYKQNSYNIKGVFPSHPLLNLEREAYQACRVGSAWNSHRSKWRETPIHSQLCVPCGWCSGNTPLISNCGGPVAVTPSPNFYNYSNTKKVMYPFNYWQLHITISEDTRLTFGYNELKEALLVLLPFILEFSMVTSVRQPPTGLFWRMLVIYY